MDNNDFFVRAKKRINSQLLRTAVLKQSAEALLRSRLARMMFRDALLRDYAGVCVLLGESLSDLENLERFESTMNSSIEALDRLKDRLCEVFRKEKRGKDIEIIRLREIITGSFIKRAQQEKLIRKLVARIRHYVKENKEYAYNEKMLRFRLESAHVNNAELLGKIRYLRNVINLKKVAERMKNEEVKKGFNHVVFRPIPHLISWYECRECGYATQDRLSQCPACEEAYAEKLREKQSANEIVDYIKDHPLTDEVHLERSGEESGDCKVGEKKLDKELDDE